MNWVAIDELSSKLPIPDGYRIEQLKRSEIPEVIRCFRDWFPDITVGAESCYQREDFYSREVSLEGEPERDVIVLLVKKDQELVAIASLQRSEDTLTLYGRLVGSCSGRSAAQKSAGPGAIPTGKGKRQPKRRGLKRHSKIGRLRSPSTTNRTNSTDFRLRDIRARPWFLPLTTTQPLLPETDVRFWSKGDMCAAKRHVRFTPQEQTLALHKSMSAKGQKRTSKHLTGLVALLRSFEPLRREQEVVEGLGSWCHTLGLRTKNLGVGGQHFDIVCFVDSLDDSRRHH
jgi:hypothetical protein